MGSNPNCPTNPAGGYSGPENSYTWGNDWLLDMLTHPKPPSPEQVREFVVAGHGDLERVKSMLANSPELLNAAYQWSENDRETAIQAAAQTGSVPIAEYLLEKGAPLDICTAAMLGRNDEVERLLELDPDSINATGAHRIPLLAHAAMSGNLRLLQLLYQRGARTGIPFALHNAVSRGHYDVVRWLLENRKPDLGWKNFQGKTALTVAVERKHENIARLLREHGATE